ncbi:MAG: response regulator, partial [Thermoanaerobaculia bacterium]
NARDAIGRNGGKLTIAASLATSFGSFPFGVVKSPDRYVHFRVTDNGSGMTREQLAHVFEPLFTTKTKGTGLGLAVSYQLVLQHEGYMFVESELGKGSTFHIFVLAGSPVLRLVEADLADAVGLERVLIVEDEVAVATGLKALLEMEAMEVMMVHTGGEAIPALTKFGPDCVILDIGLPDIDGVQIYREIERNWPDLPVLFSSGHADAAKLEAILRKPTTALLQKPYEFETLRSSLKRLTAARPRAKLQGN